jgi:tRNA(Arg) A34 adenosine deaminase TadA
MRSEQVVAALRYANEVAREAVAQGHHPFGAVLIAPDGDTVLMRQGNINTVNHAEAVLIRCAAEKYSTQYLWQCTLVTNVEPCAMCSGTLYWAHIGRVVFGITEERLLSMTGKHEENPTLNLPCREVFARGQKTIEVIGPVAEIESEVMSLHATFWHKHV